MHATPLLALLLVAAPEAAPEAASAGALAGCRAERVPDHGWKLRCRVLIARIEDRGGAGLKHLRAASEREVAKALGEGLEKWAEHRVLAGREVQVRRFHSAAKERTAWTAALPLPEGTRLLTCEAVEAGAHCAEVLETLALLAWRAEPGAGALSLGERPLLLGGLVVAVPSGCTGEVLARGGGLIKCPEDHSAAWRTAADQAEGARLVAAFDARFERAYSPGTGVWDDAVPCRLAGAATTCSRWFGKRDGEPQVALAATVPSEGQVLYAECLARAEPGPGTPCRQLFQVRGRRARPEAPADPAGPSAGFAPAEEFTDPVP